MNTTQLECFLAVADFLNFSRAAEHLRITQPAVSHQVKTLEDELGVPLFSRTSKSVRLTREGHMFLQYAGEMLKLAGLCKAQVRQCRAERPQYLGIGCRSASHLQLIRPALERLRLEEPEVLPLLRLIPLSALDNLLADGEVQVMFTFEDGAPKNSIYRELIPCPVMCVCREDHPLASQGELTLAQLKDGGRIAASRPPFCPPALFAIQGQIITALHPDQVIFCERNEVMFTLVEAGYAFAIIADMPPLRQPGLRYLPLQGYPPLSFGAAWLSGSHSPALRRFLSLLSETIQAQGQESGPAPARDA